LKSSEQLDLWSAKAGQPQHASPPRRRGARTVAREAVQLCLDLQLPRMARGVSGRKFPRVTMDSATAQMMLFR
jgi:hypothetical protein